MNIQELIPDVLYDNGVYKFKNIFWKYILNTPIEEKFLQIYRLSDGQSLEDVSNELYNDTIFFWTIMS